MPSSEHDTLGDIYNFLTHKTEVLQRVKKFDRFTQIIALGLFITATSLIYFTEIPKFAGIFIGAAGGVMLSIPWHIRLVLSRLAHLSPYIDEQSIKSRIDLLKHAA